MPTFRAVPQTTSYINNGIATDVTKTQTYYSQQGVSQPPMFMMNVIPAANSATVVAPVWATVLVNTPMPLTTAGSITFLGYSGVVLLDCYRPLLFTFGGTTTSATTITIRGWDDRNVAVTCSFTVPTATAATIPIFSQKAFLMIRDIQFSANPGVTVSVGTGSCIGFPFYISRIAQIVNAKWNNVAITTTATTTGTIIGNSPTTTTPSVLNLGYQWRTGYSQTPKVYPTATTSDARGLIILDPTTGGTSPANGTSVFAALIYVYGADSYVQAGLQNNIVSTQTYVKGITGVSTTTAPPTLVYADEVGWQYPGDNSYNGTANLPGV